MVNRRGADPQLHGAEVVANCAWKLKNGLEEEDEGEQVVHTGLKGNNTMSSAEP